MNLDSISITAFECSRKDETVTSERKFKADCGEKVVAKLNRGGRLIEVISEPDHRNCVACNVKISFVTKLILSGK